MRLDLVVCPDCEGKCFFGDEVCEGCLGRGYVPESDGTCLYCNERCWPGFDECEACLIKNSLPAVEVLPESVGEGEVNPQVVIGPGTVEVAWLGDDGISS
jgi:hypothetical protein